MITSHDNEEALELDLHLPRQVDLEEDINNSSNNHPRHPRPHRVHSPSSTLPTL